ncbi:DNA-binding SARP family transcriptional activator [Tamaricihabitans halophyticus]|uniref:DNA-binding SARP family transcriptional activator n=1 Tax=Tamaricihabitans halophyticus TaxID=1262583 RepID=A0A4V2SV61_9PSEU|nr:AfsR/SARP family transcriptional regulator [Tamaricihabitans halophyticus]TCP56806.1 DNA-binding SARP family transcriptional activator [Tamaricihabitans halophyticus]
MKISILGPLEVARGGTVATPSAPKLRRVLSLLALRSNNVVRNDQLVEELWEQSPPVSVTTTLQTYIYQLRKLLDLRAPNARANGGAPTVNTLHSYPNGYMLAVAPEALDAYRFEHSVRHGYQLSETNEVSEAASALRQALSIWRGPALVDVEPGPLLQAELLRLEKLRESALELRLDTELRLGKHQELLGELTGLAAQQPTQEAFQAKLMLALYRSGQRNEALDVYQRARKALATELGLEPTREIQRMHRAILCSDSSLDLKPAPEKVVTRFRPSRHDQLAPESRPLTGRDCAINLGLAALSPTQSAPGAAVVVGPPGSGKSAFCAHIARQLVNEYPDGQLYAHLLDADGNRLEPNDVLVDLLRKAGIRPDELAVSFEERVDQYRDLTSRSKALIVLDDAVDDQQLFPLLPSRQSCGVIIASRRRVSLPFSQETIDLAPLPDDASLALLAEAIGQERVRSDLETAHELVSLCDGLPLVLHATARRLFLRPHWTIEFAVRWLRQQYVDAATTSADPLGLRRSVERTYKQLAESVQATFGVPSPSCGRPYIRPENVSKALGVDASTAESLLEDLAEARLLEVEPDNTSWEGFRYRYLSCLWTIGRQIQLAKQQSPNPSIARPRSGCLNVEGRV